MSGSFPSHAGMSQGGGGDQWGGQEPPPQQRGPPALLPEEQKILSECQRESFYYRSLPYAGVFSLGTFSAVRLGYLRPSLRYGPVPKVVMASVFGYFVGKFSYANVCADKFLVQAPDSNIAEAVRRRRGLPPRNEDAYQYSPSSSEGGGGGAADPLMERREEDVPQAVPVTKDTYEELRRQNRAQAEARGFGIRQPPPPSPPPSPPSYQRGGESDIRPGVYEPGPVRPKSTNKYGDEGFE